ncbi:hypothetical protein ACFLQL_00640 [Verrucomicrobiota bacterium]
MKHTVYKVVKGFQGGPITYYAILPAGKKVKYGYWEDDVLHAWGESTPGGHNYGYRIKATRVKAIPKGTSMHRRLKFNKYWLENKKK